MSKTVRLSHTTLLILLSLGAGSARAVIVYGNGTGVGQGNGTGQNLGPPTGSFANSGHQFEGGWQVGVGTAIAPNWFLTAKHLNGSAGNVFVMNNVTYTTTAIVDDPLGSDLRLVQIAETFTNYAQLYTNQGTDVTGLMSVYGRGGPRGAAILGRDGTTEQGYQWDNSVQAISWGANRVSTVLTLQGGPAGDFLTMQFSATPAAGVPASAVLSAGDSGGGAFIQDSDGVWKLAGVNYAVDGNFSLSEFSDYFIAAMYDTRGFYVGNERDHILVPTTGSPSPQSSYLSRVSTRAAWISSVTAVPVPEPGSLALVATGFAVVSLATKARRARSRRNRVC